MPFKELSEVFDASITLPIRGKAYRIDPPSALVGLRLQTLSATGMKAALAEDPDLTDEQRQQLALSDEDRESIALDDQDSEQFTRDVLGAAYDTMLADGVSLPEIGFATTTAFLAWTVSPEMAQVYWEAGGKAQKPTPNRAARRASTRKSTAADSTTKTPASTTGTSSPTDHKKASKTKASPSPKSSTPTGP